MRPPQGYRASELDHWRAWTALDEDPSRLVTALVERHDQSLKRDSDRALWLSNNERWVIKMFLPGPRRCRGRRRRAAFRALLNASRVTAAGFATPRALGAFSHKVLQDRSWLVLERSRADPLAASFAGRSAEGRARLARALVDWLVTLHAEGLCHGDLKRANLLVTKAEAEAEVRFELLDLDAMCSLGWLPTRRAGKDLGMLLSSAGGYLDDETLGALFARYIDSRTLDARTARALKRRALQVAHRRWRRGSTPASGGWPRD
jgi:tRNA A-37 threonylcarbamoyl transferase component Bud32